MRRGGNWPLEGGPIQLPIGTWAPRLGRLVRVQRDDVQDGQTGEDPDPFHLTVHVGLHIRSSMRIDEKPAS